ncbi:hypothetical protein IBZ15_03150 [Serratia marcescens]|uniref:alpha/beta hydrolase family esterase n=1 Tax=Serratia marcescens TaxID=615 RepID=UPI0039B5556A
MKLKFFKIQLLLLFIMSLNSFANISMPLVGEQVYQRFSEKSGGERSYFIAHPKVFKYGVKYKLIIVFAGTNSTGEEMREWFGKGWQPTPEGLEDKVENAIFVYPNQKYQWGEDKGWALGSYAGEFSGNEDINFTKELIIDLLTKYPIDKRGVFAIGHSWGGDMTAVVGCYLGNKFRAVIPIAANRPYWFNGKAWGGLCNGKPSVWTFFGAKDDYFGEPGGDGIFGIELNEFWRKGYSCSKSFERDGETKIYNNCTQDVRFSIYSPGQYSGGGDFKGHQPPDYLIEAVSKWINNLI